MSKKWSSCSVFERLPKATLLAMLNSYIDETQAIEVGTGKIINLKNISALEKRNKIDSGEWVYYERLQPRRMMVTNPNWTIVSFDPSTRNVCVNIYTKSGVQTLNFTLPQVSAKF